MTNEYNEWLIERCGELMEQNEKYREVLKFYANEKNVGIKRSIRT